MSRWFRTYGYADVLDNLIIGAYPLDAGDLAMLEWLGVERVLNLTEDVEYEGGDRAAIEDAYAHSEIEEYRIAMTDFGDLPALMLETATRTVNEWLDEGLRVYLHCRAGQQRSAAVAAGVLALRDGLEIDVALARVRARKPTADPLPNQREDLRQWWSSRREDPSQPPAPAGS